MDPSLQAALEDAAGARVQSERQVAGGDINQALAVRFEDGQQWFVKTHPRPPREMFTCEAHGLRWLAAAGTIHVPRVLHVRDSPAPAFLALELLQPAPRTADYDEQLGRGLAALHRAGAHGFGLERDNYIAILPQDNRSTADWASFYAERRLLPQLRLASDSGRASSRMRSGMERLVQRLPELTGSHEPPARLHGDLWGGNVMPGSDGQPCLIDPAVYGGHREIDLAMMRLFGGFSERVFAAYDECYPRSAGHQERVALYQLYPLMVHVNLFGGGYAGQVERILHALV